MIKKYFKLFPTCTFINGDNCGCLYDTSSGKMIQLDHEKASALAKSENNIPILQIKEDTSFFMQLKQMGIGDYYDNPIYVEPINSNYITEKEKILPQNYLLKKLYLEISTECNLNCIFCKRDNTLFRKTGCKLWPQKQDEELDFEKYAEIIKSFKKLQGEEIIFIGADPLLKLDKMKKIIDLAKKNGINRFTIYTNGSLITSNMIDFFSQNNITLSLEIFSLVEETYKLITGQQLKKDDILNAIKEMKYKNVNVIANVLISKYNQNEIESIIKTLKEYLPQNRINVEFIYNKPENNHYSPKWIKSIYDRNRYFGKVDTLKINFLKLYNSCLYGKIAVDIYGDVFLCPMMKAIKLGNIKRTHLIDVLRNSRYDEYIRVNKDRIRKCSACSFKYNCTECRAIEMSATNDILGVEYCNY